MAEKITYFTFTTYEREFLVGILEREEERLNAELLKLEKKRKFSSDLENQLRRVLELKVNFK